MAWTMVSQGTWPTNKGKTTYTLWSDIVDGCAKLKIDAEGGDLIIGPPNGQEVVIVAGTSLILDADSMVAMGWAPEMVKAKLPRPAHAEPPRVIEWPGDLVT